MTRIKSTLILIFLLGASSTQAELSKVGAGGFTTSHTVDVAAPPDAAWRQLTDHVSEWWNGDHSWSGDADNLYVEARAGGCFCERLSEGGWVEHLRIIYLAPGSVIRFEGALGPLVQMGLRGTMTWSIEAAEGGGSRISFTYVVHGFLPDGMDGIAPAVDGVIGEQLERLAARLGSA